MDIATGIKVVKTGVELTRKILSAIDKNDENTNAILAAYDRTKEDWRLERERLIRERLGRMEHDEAAWQKLRDSLTEEFFFLQENYRVEAFREARKERRHMLACAAAGAIDPSMPLRDVCRVERTLRMLEPDDVRCLGSLAAIPATLEPRQHEDGAIQVYRDTPPTARLAAARAHQLSFDALLAAGCLRQEDPNEYDVEDAVVVTEIGRLVLRVLGDYLAMRAAEEVADAP